MLLMPSQIKLFESRGTDTPHVYMHAWTLGCFHGLIGTQTLHRALTASVDSCVDIRSAPSVVQSVPAEFGGRCQKVRLGVKIPTHFPVLFKLEMYRLFQC